MNRLASLVTTQALQVRVTDLFRPIVETGLVESLTGSAATLKGEIVDDGGLMVPDRGILFSIDPDPEPWKPGVVDLPAGQGAGLFSAQAIGLVPRMRLLPPGTVMQGSTLQKDMPTMPFSAIMLE